jgi:signal peptidase II
MKARTRALLLFAAVLLGSAGCDHASKQVALATLGGEGPLSLAGDAVRLELAYNAGAFLSAGADLPEGVRRFLLIGLVPLGVAALCAHFLRARELPVALAVGLGLLAGGGLANWADRILHDGLVTDFILLRVAGLHTGVFNLADVAVVAGVLLLALSQHRAPSGAA